MLGKDHCLPVDAKFVSGGEILFDKEPELDSLHVMSDVTLHVNMTHISDS